MAVSTPDIVTPVLAAAKVVVLLLAGVAAQTCFRDFFRGFVLERDDLLRVAFFNVCLAWSMARLATRHLVFPTADFYELRVGGVREGLKLIFVTVFTRLTTDVIFGLVFGLAGLINLRGTAGTKPDKGCSYEDTNQECFDHFKHRAFLEFHLTVLTPFDFA